MWRGLMTSPIIGLSPCIKISGVHLCTNLPTYFPDCLQCFNCSRSSDMSKCTEVTQCQFGQSCFQRIEDNGGLALISMGCTDNQKCGSNQNGGSIVLGYKRETLQDCYECCSTYNCNKYLCAKAPCNCNFDDDTMCAWTNLKTDDFDWIIAHGTTTSSRTGPRYDHTRKDNK
ncbi:MAM and LDL-receptor class A domain-containing protein 1-like, partial [Ruditapes philippinarum]|uniref:MAM and LDL-receptor class A domain-containing protein 1-like n=1 Tax=Ruditapes philippinarum TaxID=129788 RepID=UPI00295C03CB